MTKKIKFPILPHFPNTLVDENLVPWVHVSSRHLREVTVLSGKDSLLLLLPPPVLDLRIFYPFLNQSKAISQCIEWGRKKISMDGSRV